MTETPQLSPQQPTRHGSHSIRLAVLLSVVVSLFVVVVLPSATAASEFDPRFPLVAAIDFTNCQPTCAEGVPLRKAARAHTVWVDSARRRIYVYKYDNFSNFPRGVAVVDADRLVQTDWIDLGPNGLNLPSSKFTRSAYDTTRARMFIGEESAALGCISTASTTGCGGTARFAVVDLANRTSQMITLPQAGLGVIGSRQMPPGLLEGDSIAALTYDGVRQRLYILTSGGQQVDKNKVVGNYDGKGAAIVAYDATSLSSASVPLWVYRPRACPSVLPQKSSEAPYFDVGNDGSFVYLACRGIPLAAQHGIVRVNVPDPSGGGDPTSNFTTEWFPFAGDASTGYSLGDPGNDRVGVVASGFKNKRLYVFDAGHRAWVGSMLLGGPTTASTGSGGADPGTGRMYVYVQDVGLAVIDLAAKPAIVFRDPLRLANQPVSVGELAVDPLTHRVMDIGGGNHLWVYEDRAPSYIPPVEKNPDADTHDLDEDKANQVSHTAFGTSYGAHALFVRGVSGLPVVGGTADALGSTPLRVEGGDRGLFLSQVSWAELSGERDAGTASATAVAARIDEATKADLKGKYGQIGISGNSGEPCNQSQPGTECLSFDSLVANVGQLHDSSCKDFENSGDSLEASGSGSTVECRSRDKVAAWASASSGQPSDGAQAAFSVADSESRVDLVKDPEGGIETVSTARAAGVTLKVPGVGTLSIGEIVSTATSRAAGRPNTAKSTFSSTAKNVRIIGADGRRLFACGLPVADPDVDDCESSDITGAINQYLAPRVEARGPRQELDPSIVNSPGGARAIVEKDRYAFLNDTTINGDAQREVTGLELTVYNDTTEASRLVLKLAGVYSEAQYVIGAPKPEVFVGPTKLSLELVDDLDAPLAGGVFQIRKAGQADPLRSLTGDLAAACVTAEDGVGDCEFNDLAPGDYVVTQPVAPAGYAASEPSEVTLESGFETIARFTNLRALGRISISLTDDGGGDGGDPAPLSGATFAVLSDDGDLVRGSGDQAYDECTTDGTGSCAFEEVPLGAYVVYERTAPPGYLKADDAGFVLELPGQAAGLSFVTGLEGSASVPSSSTEMIDDWGGGGPLPIVQVTKRPRPLPRRGIGGIVAQTSEAFAFVARNPLQALLFALVWFLMASPMYLALRRRTLTLARGVL